MAHRGAHGREPENSLAAFAAALAAAGIEYVLAELRAGHMDVGMHPTASDLWTTFLVAQLRP